MVDTPMKESAIRATLAIIGVCVGILGGAVSAYLTMVGRIERRVEERTEARVNQAVLMENAKTQEQRWWMQQNELDAVRSQINSLRIELAGSKKNSE